MPILLSILLLILMFLAICVIETDWTKRMIYYSIGLAIFIAVAAFTYYYITHILFG